MEGDGDFFTGAEEVPAEGAPEQVRFSRRSLCFVFVNCAALLLPHSCPPSPCC